jgi:RNA polymerase sigma-70 factor (ECF subfamily)
MRNNFKAFSDSELAKLLKGSKMEAESAFKELYDRHSPSIHAYCLKIVGDADQAEDVFQDTFIKFYQNIDPNLTNLNVFGFIIKIARNLCLNLKRDRKQTIPIDELDYLFKDTQNYEQKELLDLINRSLDLLDEEYREAFVLREYSGLDYNQIALVSNISVSNAKSRVFRAKQKIKMILKPYLKDLSL